MKRLVSEKGEMCIYARILCQEASGCNNCQVFEDFKNSGIDRLADKVARSVYWSRSIWWKAWLVNSVPHQWERISLN